jgi:hypothetical protein
MVDSNPTHDTYLVISTNKEGDKIKVTPENILLDKEDMRPAEKYGPAFIKRNQNSSLYGAQMLRSCINKIKPNKWVENYGINLSKVRQEHLSTFASSKIKGFIWLLCSHALPVGTRLQGKGAKMECPHCGEPEDIRHMAFDCLVAKYIRKKVFKEWWAHTTDCSWVMHPTFKSCFFNKGDNTLEIAKRTLNDIATYHIWRYRCNIIYGVHYMREKSIWKLYHSTNTKFLASCKDLLIFSDRLYKFNIIKE